MSYIIPGIDVVVPSAHRDDTKYPDTEEGVKADSIEYFSELAGSQVSVHVVTMNGPAGGNPMVNLLFVSREAALKCMTAYCDGDESEALELYFE